MANQRTACVSNFGHGFSAIMEQRKTTVSLKYSGVTHEWLSRYAFIFILQPISSHTSLLRFFSSVSKELACASQCPAGNDQNPGKLESFDLRLPNKNFPSLFLITAATTTRNVWYFFISAPSRDRTYDLLLKREQLYQLSYGRNFCFSNKLDSRGKFYNSTNCRHLSVASLAQQMGGGYGRVSGHIIAKNFD